MGQFVECMGTQPIGWRLPNTSLYWYYLLDWDIFPEKKIHSLAWEVRVRVARGESVILVWLPGFWVLDKGKKSLTLSFILPLLGVLSYAQLCLLSVSPELFKFKIFPFPFLVGWQRCRNHMEEGTWGVVTVYISKNQSPFTSSHLMSLHLFYFVFKFFFH